MLKKIIFVVLIAFVIVLAVCLSINKANAEEVAIEPVSDYERTYDVRSNFYSQVDDKTKIDSTNNDAGTINTAGTITTDGTDTDKGTITTTNRRYGNIGVTMSQDMARKEMDVRPEMNMMNYIIKSFKNRFCLLVY